ncbi:hypothetical protein [Providencia sp. PROV140]|uniref:hypothetical protein n=1 Tax=Providencia sp. PROV140 TaxID=2949850 RepID=UPI00234A0788|nr:hypothetical protein [Providencia sp. PROV140]
MKVEHLYSSDDGTSTFMLNGEFLTGYPSCNKKWFVCTSKNDKENTLWDNRITLILDEVVQLIMDAPKGHCYRVYAIATNGIFLFSLHNKDDNSIVAIVVADKHGKVLYRMNCTALMMSADISEFGKFAVLSIARSKDKENKDAGKILVIDVGDSEIIKSTSNQIGNLYFSSVNIFEPNGDVLAFYQGNASKVEFY